MVNLVGNSTLTVSLPSKWTKDNDVKIGDELNVDLTANKIIFSKSYAKDKKEAKLNLDNVEYHSLVRYMKLIYRLNYTKICLTYSKPEIWNNKKQHFSDLYRAINNLCNELMGSEIIYQTDKKTEVEFFVLHQSHDLKKVEKRIKFLFKDYSTHLFNNIDSNMINLYKNMFTYYQNITRLVNFVLREINFTDYSEDKKKIIYAFYTSLDKLANNLRYISQSIQEFGCTSKLKDYIDETFGYLEKQFEILDDVSKSSETLRMRYDILERLRKEKFSKEEFPVLMRLYPFFVAIKDFSDYSLVLKLDKSQINTMSKKE